LITIHNTWRTIYYVATALIGGLLLLVFFTFPETSYNRELTTVNGSEPIPTGEKSALSIKHIETGGNSTIPRRKTYFQELRILSGTHTSENLLNLFIRPIALIILPPALWGSLVMSVTIGFLVAVTSNVAPAYSAAYGFEAWQTGLCFISAIIGSLIGILIGGHMSDKIADWFTKRNGGVREPEMRLPSIAVSLITTPLALILYGVGIQNKLHWICPTVGLGLRKSMSTWRV
jgi:Major Facilitator Superfamily